MENRTKAQKEIEKILNTNLPQGIAAEVKALADVRKQDAGFHQQIKSLEARADKAKECLDVTQERVHYAIISGKVPEADLREVEVKMAEVAAFKLQKERLIAQDREAGVAEKQALQSLTEALGREIFASREEVAQRVKALVEEALWLMIWFEEQSLEICHSHGIELGSARDYRLGRFLECSEIVENLEPFCLAIGEAESVFGRRTIRDKLRADLLKVNN